MFQTSNIGFNLAVSAPFTRIPLKISPPLARIAFTELSACSKRGFSFLFLPNIPNSKPTYHFQKQLLLPCMCCSHGFHMEQIVALSLVDTHVPSARVTAASQSHAGSTRDVACYWEGGFMGSVGGFKQREKAMEQDCVL